jgi:hypothetical protein
MIASQPTIDSAILRLAKERNEARELCKRLFWCLPAEGGAADHNAINDAYYAYLRASRGWKEGGHE